MRIAVRHEEAVFFFRMGEERRYNENRRGTKVEAGRPLSPLEPWFPIPLTLRAYVRQTALSLPWWSLLVALEGAQVMMTDASHGYVLPMFHYFIWAAFNWYAWAPLTPVVLAIARAYPLTRERWAERILYPHAIACVALVAVHAVLRGTAGWIYTFWYEVHAPLPDLIVEALEKEGMWSVLAYSGVVGVTAFLWLRQEVRQRELRQAQLEARLASAELEMLRMQIHPHFLFNTLQAAITLVREEPGEAEDVLLRLSELLRISLEEMGTAEVTLARELEFLDLYVGIQRRRFGDRLRVEIHADEAALSERVPPLLLQPLVENAIRHGIGKHKGDDTIEVDARLDAGGLELEVRNGNSVMDEGGEALFQRGLGLRNTRARLERLYGPGARLGLRAKGKRGAVARISIPPRLGPVVAGADGAGVAL
jgi:two-component system LytT family sensor kinase